MPTYYSEDYVPPTPRATRGGHSKCSAHGCDNDRGDKSLSFFRFPKDKERCKIWIRRCGRYDLLELPPEKCYSRQLCSSHFAKECFFYHASKNKLMKNALPTIFESVPEEIVKGDNFGSIYKIPDVEAPTSGPLKIEHHEFKPYTNITLDTSKFEVNSINLSLEPSTFTFDPTAIATDAVPFQEIQNGIPTVHFQCLNNTEEQKDTLLSDVSQEASDESEKASDQSEEAPDESLQEDSRSLCDAIEQHHNYWHAKSRNVQSRTQTSTFLNVNEVYQKLVADPPHDWAILVKQRTLHLFKLSANNTEVFLLVEIDPTLAVNVLVKGEPLAFNHPIRSYVPDLLVSLPKLTKLLTQLDKWHPCLGNFELKYQDCPSNIKDGRYVDRTRSFHHIHCKVIVMHKQRCSYCCTLRDELDAMLILLLPKIRPSTMAKYNEVLSISGQIKQMKEEKAAQKRKFPENLKTYGKKG